MMGRRDPDSRTKLKFEVDRYVQLVGHIGQIGKMIDYLVSFFEVRQFYYLGVSLIWHCMKNHRHLIDLGCVV